MSKLVATYAEGMFAVFTEDRAGMRQRALIDIGDKIPTPSEMAKLAGVLSDQWGWQNGIERAAPKAKALPTGRRGYERDEITKAERERRIVEYLAKNPKSDARQIIAGCGFEPDDKRYGRWHHSFVEMKIRQQIISEIITVRRQGGAVRKALYSLA